MFHSFLPFSSSRCHQLNGEGLWPTRHQILEKGSEGNLCRATGLGLFYYSGQHLEYLLFIFWWEVGIAGSALKSLNSHICLQYQNTVTPRRHLLPALSVPLSSPQGTHSFPNPLNNQPILNWYIGQSRYDQNTTFFLNPPFKTFFLV